MCFLLIEKEPPGMKQRREGTVAEIIVCRLAETSYFLGHMLNRGAKKNQEYIYTMPYSISNL